MVDGAGIKGLVRLEGKEYIMRDGDIVHFRFNVNVNV
jgi:ribosome-binding ATPase YchF (GTP1/OBG family)